MHTLRQAPRERGLAVDHLEQDAADRFRNSMMI